MQSSPIIFTLMPDNTYELLYFGAVIGWARREVSTIRPGEVLWRAVSIHGDIRHCHSLDAARSALLALHH